MARELARPRPDFGLLRRLRRDFEATEDRLAGLERGGSRLGVSPASGRPADGGT